MLSDESIAYIRTLPPALTALGARFVHGFPPDRINTYLFQVTESELIEVFTKMAEPCCFVGHTHNLEIIRYDGNQLDYLPLQIGITELPPAFRYILNIGSVGQPRDGNNNAKYIIWNTDDSTVELRYVSYDIAAVVEKIQKAGLPEINAVRLW
jgi:diadenosine tetraphosphatase ApaH/serine/threonine PP2A family protein phosphatase